MSKVPDGFGLSDGAIPLYIAGEISIARTGWLMRGDSRGKWRNG
jgi:hypothetical protein